jgi:hypothetical protein
MLLEDCRGEMSVAVFGWGEREEGRSWGFESEGVVFGWLLGQVEVFIQGTSGQWLGCFRSRKQ